MGTRSTVDMSYPLLQHPLEQREAFTAESLVRAVQAQRQLADATVPDVCVLDFDGDLTDKLLQKGLAQRYPNWACFHTQMAFLELNGSRVGIVPRTIGGPFAVLVAEQLFVSGVKVVVGLTSAGRIAPDLPLPHVLVADEALRDEGTSYHYIPPSRTVHAPAKLADRLYAALRELPIPIARGLIWTTDAPYRETNEQIRRHSLENVLAVEMQAASLFALAARKGYEIGVVAHVTNAIDDNGEPFNKGPDDLDEQLLSMICRAAAKHSV